MGAVSWVRRRLIRWWQLREIPLRDNRLTIDPTAEPVYDNLRRFWLADTFRMLGHPGPCASCLAWVGRLPDHPDQLELLTAKARHRSALRGDPLWG